MSFETFNDPISYRIRKGSVDDPFIEIQQTDKVRNGTILLREIPDKFNGISITNGTINLATKDSGLPDVNTVVVDWTNGILTFDDAYEGQIFTIDFMGRGNVYLPATKVYTNVDENGNVTETLQTLVNDTESARDNANEAADNLIHKGEYDNTTQYKKRNIVTYQGSSYMAIEDTLGNLPTDSNYWKKITSFNWKGVYSSSTKYSFGDFVTDSNKRNIYMSLKDNNIGNSLSDVSYWTPIIYTQDLIDNIIQATNDAIVATENANTATINANNAADNANEIADNFVHVGSYENDTQYKKRNIVIYQGSAYIATQDTIGNLPTDENYWRKLTSFNWKGIYDPSTTYSSGDFVQDANQRNLYLSLTDSNIGNPLTDTIHWKQLISVEDIVNSATQAINNANQATEDAIAAATLANEAANDAINTATNVQEQANYAQSQGDYAKEQGDYAKNVGDNLVHKGEYNNTVPYKKGNIVTYNGITYMCIQNTTAGILPTDGTYWSVVSPQTTINDETWIATEGQTVFTLTNGSYDVGKGHIEVWVGGVPQVSGEGFIETDSTTITLTEGVPAGTQVYAKWFEGAISITKGHKNSHYVGGSDELDVTQLKNYEEQINSRIGILFDNLNYRNVKRYGVIGASGGSLDDTIALNNLEEGYTYIFPPDTYYIKAHTDDGLGEGGFRPKSNTRYIFLPGAKLKAITNDKDRYAICVITGDNIEIHNITCEGDRTTHTGTTGEQGYGIAIRTTGKVKIFGATCYDCWGDGVLVSCGSGSDIELHNIISYNNRRQGISILSVDKFRCYKSIFKNSNGTSPECGLDIEPWTGTDILNDIIFEDCRFDDNVSSGVLIYGGYYFPSSYNIQFIRCKSKNNGTSNGFVINDVPKSDNGVIKFIDCEADNPYNGVFIRNAEANIIINNFLNINPKYAIQFESNLDNKNCGNVTARNFQVINNGQIIKAVYFNYTTKVNNKIKDVDIEISKHNLTPSQMVLKIAGTYEGKCIVKVDSTFDSTSHVFESSLKNYLYQQITNSGATADISCELNNAATTTVGTEVEFMVKSNFYIHINAVNKTIYPFNSVRIRSNEVGARIRLRYDGTSWYVLQSIGTWAVY
jgi:hypothetical protein